MKQWYKNRKKDHFYQLAKKNDLISRAYYKLEEIDKKHQIIKKSSKVLDIGCCPGGWTQYVLNKSGNQSVVGVDILPIEEKFDNNFTFYNFDLNEFDKISDLFVSKNYCFDVIISDIAPNTSGNQFLDQANSYNLSFLSFQFIKSFLKVIGKCSVSFQAKFFVVFLLNRC